MINEVLMPEFEVFNMVGNYLKNQEWENVSISKTMLDDGEVGFNIFLKSGEFTFMQTKSRTDFEELVMASFNDTSVVKVLVWNGEVSYSFTPNKENVVQR